MKKEEQIKKFLKTKGIEGVQAETISKWFVEFQSLTEPTQEGVVSAEEVLRKYPIYSQNLDKVSGDNIDLYELKDVLKAMHTYASQTREEEMKKPRIDEAFVEWYVTNGFYRNSDGFHRTGQRVGQKFIIEELYNEYLNTLNSK